MRPSPLQYDERGLRPLRENHRINPGPWPDGRICGICFTNATHRYGQCTRCSADRLLPSRTDTGEDTCRECAGITTNLTCDNCGREGERFRGGHCITCVLTTDLTELLRPNDPPDLRLKRLIKILTDSTRPESRCSMNR